MPFDRNIIGHIGQDQAASALAISLAKRAGSRASPQTIRWRPTAKMSPGWAIAQRRIGLERAVLSSIGLLVQKI